MNSEKTYILNSLSIQQKVTRMAYEILEEFFGQDEVCLAGIIGNGAKLARLLASELTKIGGLKVNVIEINLNKRNLINQPVLLSPEVSDQSLKNLIIVDDVLNSGKTMFYALAPFLKRDIYNLKVAVLVNRSHKSFPVHADFVGLSLATTLEEHVNVELEDGNYSAWLH